MPKIFYTDTGKPYFCDRASANNCLHERTSFSISHDGSIACVALGDNNEKIGIDIQRVGEMPRNAAKIYEKFLSPLEKDNFFCADVLDEQAFELSFFRFSDKEIILSSAEDFSACEISESEMSSDFFGMWTALEASYKAFGEGSLISFANKERKPKKRLKSFRLSLFGCEYIFTLAVFE